MSYKTKSLPRVLVVDDQPENIAVLVEALGGLYTIIAARNGVDALRLIRQSPPPDLVLLDIMMPDVDGYEVCRQIKAAPATRAIPVIFLSALTAEADELRGLALGAVDYVHKPISVPLVQARVATHLKLAAQIHALEEEARLREEMERITRYDLKDSLTLILAYPELLLHASGLAEGERELLTEIRTAGFHMLGVINRTLDLYKLESGRYRYQPVQRNLSELLTKCLAGLEPLTEGKEIHLECSLPPLSISLDELLALALFTSLIRNAIEASPAGGVISVEIKTDDGQAVTRITNPGAVPVELREGFFDKDVPSAKPGGSRLGNYSAELMAQTMGGEIRMETDDAWGTCITVRLPLVADAHG